MKIISNTAISVDGKISTRANRFMRLGSDEDHRMMSRIRAKADAVLVGGQTYRNGPDPILPEEEDWIIDYNEHPLLNVILTRSMNIPVNMAFLADSRIHPLVLTSASHVRQDFAFEICQCHTEIGATWIVEELKRRHVENLLIEGGGQVIEMFLKENLLDEMYVTVSSKIIGGKTAPSLVAGEGFDEEHIKSLTLIDLKRIGDEVYLHYKVNK